MSIWEMRRVGPMREAKLLPLVTSALAGGDCIDDADCPRAGYDSLSSAGSTRMMPGTVVKMVDFSYKPIVSLF